MFGVPMLYNKFYDQIATKIAELPHKKRLKVQDAVDVKLRNLKHKGQYTHCIYDFFIFDKMKEALGGCVELCLSGSAPLSPHIGDFLKVAFCCPLVEGFGTTETCDGQFLQVSDQHVCGDVGFPLRHVECKLINVPELKYLVTDKNEHGQ
mmetsp:Transcript_4001/g.3416  ORF Transcript_4001/g.3416 Transcript_4001/m.3416 type:complete len:150 (-) Transcript_4001:130-579(-)